MDNQEPFLRAFGSAFHTGAPAVVRPKELHVLTHDRDGGALEDTLVLGDTAVVNRTRIGRACEIVGPDGAAMTVTARWDGDVWVEVDDALVMETRRWREGELLVVARTVTNDDGTLVTSKAFMGAPRKRAPAFEAASPGAVLALSPPGGPIADALIRLSVLGGQGEKREEGRPRGRRLRRLQERLRVRVLAGDGRRARVRVRGVQPRGGRRAGSNFQGRRRREARG